MSKRTVKLVYNGPGQQINLDVASATGDGRLVDGREIEVDGELAELLECSSPYWKRKRASSSSSKSKGKGKNQAPVVVDDPPAAEADPAAGATESQED